MEDLWGGGGPRFGQSSDEGHPDLANPLEGVGHLDFSDENKKSLHPPSDDFLTLLLWLVV